MISYTKGAKNRICQRASISNITLGHPDHDVCPQASLMELVPTQGSMFSTNVEVFLGLSSYTVFCTKYRLLFMEGPKNLVQNFSPGPPRVRRIATKLYPY